MDNAIHSPTNHISVLSSLDGTLHFSSNTCASISQGKAPIHGVEVDEDTATLMEVGYGEDENIGEFLSRRFCEESNHYVPDDENVASQQPC